LRWPDGFECPACGGRAHCVVKRGARQLFQCNACNKQTSVQAGTIFASSKLPLWSWFKPIYLVTQSKKGISSIELGRRLGVTQTTAWTVKQKLAQVMIEPNAAKRLDGNVQGRCLDRRRALRQTRTRRGGKNCLRCRCCDNRRRQTRSDHSSPRHRFPNGGNWPTREPVACGGANVVSDALACFTAVTTAGCTYPQIQTGGGAQAAKKPAFKWVNTILGNIKPALTGPPRAVPSKHVPRYLAEFEYRFNRRYRLETMIPRLAYVALRTAPMPYSLLKLADVYA
jgi:transposase-like protein